jgi:hypothetical protein
MAKNKKNKKVQQRRREKRQLESDLKTTILYLQAVLHVFESYCGFKSHS